jgi:soluble lytic murein transglycosylase-like protein
MSMTHLSRRAALVGLVLGTTACARRPAPEPAPPVTRAGLTPELAALITRYADHHQIPESLLHRVIQRESGYNPAARNGPYYGLMQILPQTAGTMGYQGPPEGLLDAETNLLYAGRYLRGAWLVSDGDEATAVGWYARGYYYEAKRRGLLRETGLRA